MKVIVEIGYKYLRILDYDKIKEKLMKDQVIKEYKRRIRQCIKVFIHKSDCERFTRKAGGRGLQRCGRTVRRKENNLG